ncbi:hypothetical protein NEMBOFW57_001641 [Staphylotrichum longicolle]|uniref:Uncharacterized protein n=1 Tax=Staphylotrichum longicolle TaxID=669026 RepID=A0AAD4F4T8_9PEZI|nr:hypothetical protein NEMBOFW57_001641 [Staphylotrichum longicolle]
MQQRAGPTPHRLPSLLLRRYEHLTSAHARDMDVLLDRLERLEHANERWLGAVVPLFEGLARRVPARLESMDSLYWGGGGGRFDGGGDINDESWLRSDSGSVSEVAADGVAGGGPQSRSRGCLAEEDEWRTTVAGRHTEAFAREQRQRQRHRQRQSVGRNLDETLNMDMGMDMDGGLEDPAGWAALESLMRELVLGTGSAGESMEGRTLVDDSVLGLGC